MSIFGLSNRCLRTCEPWFYPWWLVKTIILIRRNLGFLLNFTRLGINILLFQVSVDAIHFVWNLFPNFQLMRKPSMFEVLSYEAQISVVLWSFVCVQSFYAPIQSASACKTGQSEWHDMITPGQPMFYILLKKITHEVKPVYRQSLMLHVSVDVACRTSTVVEYLCL